MSGDRSSPKQESSSGHNRVLDEAERLFRTRGYNAVTMRDIACEVGIRQASLYYHFASKEQLFVAVTERMFERHRIGLQQAIGENSHDLRSQLHAVAGWFLSQPPIHFLSMVHTDMPLLAEENIKKLSACSYQSIFEPLRQTFIQAQERGEIRDIRPNLLAGFFLSVMESIPYTTTFPGAAPKEVMVNEMIGVLLDGLKPQ
ncbi:TetR family transcriptional regulator [Nostoc sp. B(2019)]|nr:TetR family transcriptional regulator [Nostoc sp. B(2019)]